MKVHVVVGVYKGVLNSVVAFLSGERAKAAHERVCRGCEVPLFCLPCGADSDEEHRRYKDADTDNDVRHQIIELEADPIMESLVHALKWQVGDPTTSRVVAQEFIAALNRRRLLSNAEAKEWLEELMGSDTRFSLS